MAIINMTQACKDAGIESFSRTRGGWMKAVEGYDKSQHGGYRFVGSNFVKVGNFDTDLQNGLYLDCSKPVVDGEKVEIINLFAIEDGSVELLATVPKSKRGWANDLETPVADYFAKEGVSVYDILNVVRDMTQNRELLYDVGRELTKDFNKGNLLKGNIWLNQAHFSAFMQKACVYNHDYDLNHNEEVQAMAVEMFQNDSKARFFFNDQINNDHQYRLLYAFIQKAPVIRKYKDFRVEFEFIPEDYYLNINNLSFLRDINCNDTQKGWSHDRGYWFCFGEGFANRRQVYIIVPNVPNKTLIVQNFELHL